MTTRPSAPLDRRDDPLGPPRHFGRVGRPVSPWKLHWMAHRTKWLLAAAALAVVALVAFASWAVSESARFYAARGARQVAEATATPIVPANVAVGASSRHVDGPVNMRLEIGKLEDGERVIVTRDLAKILDDRLRSAGIQLSSQGPNTLTLYYDEELSPPLQVIQEQSPSNTSPTSMRATRILVRLTLDRPRQPVRVFGENATSPSPERAKLQGPATPLAVTRMRQRLYQQTYQEALEYLRQVALPTAE